MLFMSLSYRIPVISLAALSFMLCCPSAGNSLSHKAPALSGQRLCSIALNGLNYKHPSRSSPWDEPERQAFANEPIVPTEGQASTGLASEQLALSDVATGDTAEAEFQVAILTVWIAMQLWDDVGEQVAPSPSFDLPRCLSTIPRNQTGTYRFTVY
jgi:hypothetical protein